MVCPKTVTAKEAQLIDETSPQSQIPKKQRVPLLRWSDADIGLFVAWFAYAINTAFLSIMKHITTEISKLQVNGCLKRQV